MNKRTLFKPINVIGLFTIAAMIVYLMAVHESTEVSVFSAVGEGEKFLADKMNPHTLDNDRVYDAPGYDELLMNAEIKPPMQVESFGKLIIHNQIISVANNVDESTLKNSPDWMPDSALPVEDGMCVILGNRNRTHLRVLRDVKVGDKVRFTYGDGRSADYRVTDIRIFEDTADWRLPVLEGNTLVLVTCYPFRYSGSAPGKYVVICNII